MTRDPYRRYRIARAVWLYDRWTRMLDQMHASPRAKVKAIALGDRVLRALRNMEPEDQHEYYLQIANRRADRQPTARVAAREQLSRAAGAEVIAMARAAEAARVEEGEDDHAEGLE